MAELKTRESGLSVSEFLASIDDPGTRADCRKLAGMMHRATGSRARMWGASIVGYGRYHYRYASGREGDWFECGYSPRAKSLTVYLMAGFEPFADLMDALGSFRTGKSCLYLKRLSDVDEDVLETLIEGSVAEIRRRYPK